jgi:hypothetical protein
MTKAERYQAQIQACNKRQLRTLWHKKQRGTLDTAFWKKGKFLEYAILRAFELDGAKVTYPYSVKENGKVVEQIDGAIRIGDLYALVECKDSDETAAIDTAPIAKLRGILAKRHASVFGMMFSMSNYTDAAEINIKHIHPSMIILWGRGEIEHCMENGCIMDFFVQKYKSAVERCEYNDPCGLI